MMAPAMPAGAPAGCWFDDAAAAAAERFFPAYLRHTEGEWAGKPFVLADWQADRIVRPIFGWKRPDGTRLIRQCYLEVPRKNGKTELAAGVSLLALIGDGEYGGQGYAAAVDKDQAKIVFGKAGAMVGFSEALARKLEVFKTSIFCPELMASFKPLSSNPAGKHGFSPTFGIYDEVHEWSDGELADVIHKGMGARRQPLELFTTTAGVRGAGFGWEMHDRALKVLDGTLIDPSFLAVIYAAGDKDDWTDERVWAAANPNLETSIKLDFLRAECAAARESPRKENDFKRFHLNLWTEQVTRWLSLEAWERCGGPLRWDLIGAAMGGRSCFIGLDLSAKIDITAKVCVFPPEQKGGPWAVAPTFYLPADNVRQRMERDRLPYDDWIRRGAMKTTPGNVVDYAFIEADIAEDARRYRVQEAAFDPWNATQTALSLQEKGLTMVEFGQGYKSMSEPAKEFERLITAGLLHHGGHPVLREMAKAVSVTSDPAGNIKPDKSKATLRIDGIVAAIMGLGRGIANGTVKRSFWDRAAAA